MPDCIFLDVMGGLVSLRSFMPLLLDMIYAENYMSMIIKWISIALAVASVLFFVMLIMLGANDYTNLPYPWLNPLLGPFGFLRCDSYMHDAWKGTSIFFLVFALYLSPFCDNLYARSMVFLLSVFCWSAIGFLSLVACRGW